MEGYCVICGRPATCEHHLVFGYGVRNLAEQDGLKVKMCDDCHNVGPISGRIHDNYMAEALSKMLGQMMWERDHVQQYGSYTRDKFRERYGRSYL